MSPKIVWCALTSVSIVMVLGACIKPVDVDSFLNDDKVKEIIESTKVAVIVDNQTEDNLIGRDRRIEGLNPNKYYMVEKETDADGILVPEYANTGYSYPLYVTDNEIAQMPPGGGLYPDLGFITRIANGRINGLINFHTYTVRAAEPLLKTGSLPYTDDSSANVPKTVTDGVINITSIDGKGYLDLSDVLLTESYEVIAVLFVNLPNPPDPTNPPSSPWNWESQTFTSWASFELEGPDTAIDYVFVKTDDPSDFKFLRVKIGSRVTPVDILLTIDWSNPTAPALSTTTYNFYHSTYYDGKNQTVTVNVATGTGITIDGNWKYGSTDLGSKTLTLDNSSDTDYFTEGSHIFTISVTKNGITYGLDFTLVVFKEKP